MMDLVAVAVVTSAFLFVALVIWYFLGPHRDYWNDLTRERLFDIRDRLFDAARRGDLDFDDRAYQITRMTINGMIRTVHDFSPSAFVTFAVLHRKGSFKKEADAYEERLQDALRSLSTEGKKAVLRARADMHLVVLIHFYHVSVLLWPAIIPMVNVLKLVHRLDQVRRWLLRGKNRKAFWPVLDATVHQEGLRGDPLHSGC